MRSPAAQWPMVAMRKRHVEINTNFIRRTSLSYGHVECCGHQFGANDVALVQPPQPLRPISILST